MPRAAAVLAAALAPAAAAVDVAYVALGCFWTSGSEFMCDEGLKGGLFTGIDTACPSGSQEEPTSVSDRVCTPNTTVVGYMGGTGVHPTYENYTGGSYPAPNETWGNNYSETLRLEYDPEKTSYGDILTAFWKYAGDPTYPQDDPAYKLRIFANGPAQMAAAQASLAEVQKTAAGDVYCTIYDAAEYTFWKAEEYHQQTAFGNPCSASSASTFGGVADRCRAARGAARARAAGGKGVQPA